MEADLTIVHVRPRTEEERLRDATSEVEANGGITLIPIEPMSPSVLRIEPTTPVWETETSAPIEVQTTFSNHPSCSPLSSVKKRENSRRERLRKAAGRICYRQLLHEKQDTREDEKLAMKAMETMSPISQLSISESDKEDGMEKLREAVSIHLFPRKAGEPSERTKTALYLLKKSLNSTSNSAGSSIDHVLRLIFESMKNNSMNLEVQERGCHLLTKLSRDSTQVQSAIIRKRGVQLIIDSMGTHSKAPGVQSRAIGALLCLTMDETARAQIVERRGAELVSWAMKEFPDLLLLQKNGSTCLCNLAFNSEESKRRIGRIGGIHVVVSAMNKFIGDADLQARCCLALRNLTCGLRANQWIAGRCHVMETVLRCMKLMKSDVNIQYQGCVALANLCAEEAENRSRAADLGVHKVAIELVKKHMQNASLSEHALTVLRNICIRSNQNIVSVGEDGGIDLVLSCMKVHRFSKRVVERGCGVLRYLCFSKDNRLRFAECNGIDALVRVMRDGAEHSDVSEAVLYAIGNAICDNLNSKRAVGRLGGIPALVEIMSNHLDSSLIQEHACRALRNLADADELNMRLIIECGAIDAVLLAMMGYLDNGNIQEQGCAMLVNMTMLEEGLKQMKDLEASLVVTRSKGMHIDKEMVQHQAEALLMRLKQGSHASVTSMMLPRKKASRVNTMRKAASRAAFGKRPRSEAKNHQVSCASEDATFNGKLLRLIGSSGST
ncbi:Aardvark Armadillo repeat containing protein [Gracilaria domingensis]|nr:Aardvark Armadillo repeat containing protein [Gracilaria domingensis]